MMTDEQIEMYALQNILSEDSVEAIKNMQHWIDGAKWMRDQITQNIFKTDGKLQIIHQNGQPYGIRDAGGYLLFFPKVTKYTDQEDRYVAEIMETYCLANKIIAALKPK